MSRRDLFKLLPLSAWPAFVWRSPLLGNRHLKQYVMTAEEKAELDRYVAKADSVEAAIRAIEQGRKGHRDDDYVMISTWRGTTKATRLH